MKKCVRDECVSFHSAALFIFRLKVFIPGWLSKLIGWIPQANYL